MLNKTSQFFIRLSLATAIILALISGYLIHKEHDTLSRLVHPETSRTSTYIFSRWMELQTRDPCSLNRTVGWLEMLGYRRVQHGPAQPGDYSAGPSSLTVFVRPFQYPDKEDPAQLLELRFSGDRLDGLTALAGHAPLTEWRLDPKRLAEWDT